jgi:hypothetical protein
MDTKTVKRDPVSSQTRGDQLWAIMTDAVQNVLDRPGSLRGPYVIDDNDLRLEKQKNDGSSSHPL